MSVDTNDHDQFTNEINRQQRIQSSISRCLDSAKVRHSGTRAEAVNAVLARLQSQPGVTMRVSDRNWVVLEKNGSPVQLQAAVDEVLLTDSKIGDRASVAEQVKAGNLSVEAKSDLMTAAEKSAWIAANGAAAWERLPLKRIGSNEPPTKEMGKTAYLAMSLKERIEFQKTLTESELGAILSRR